MDSIPTAFQSSRLRYVRADEEDESFMEIIPQIALDPVIQALASSGMLRSNRKQDYVEYAKAVANAMLGVSIRLLPAEAQKLNLPEDTIIGVINLGWGGWDANTAHHRNASIGLSLIEKYQNKGYGREAINWIVDWAFLHAGLHTLSMGVASFNPRGIHLYESIGFTLEGRRRETIWFNGGWHDELEFGMTETDWKRLRNRT